MDQIERGEIKLVGGIADVEPIQTRPLGFDHDGRAVLRMSFSKQPNQAKQTQEEADHGS